MNLRELERRYIIWEDSRMGKFVSGAVPVLMCWVAVWLAFTHLETKVKAVELQNRDLRSVVLQHDALLNAHTSPSPSPIPSP